MVNDELVTYAIPQIEIKLKTFWLSINY